ncbi:MAG: hypothetical protein KDK64_04605 [Chlamydiia bacterium]|nr:hypothetical protein [Chlamydiia bacterium]
MEVLTRVTVPPSFPESQPLKAREVAAMARGPLVLGGISSDGQQVLQLVEDTIEFQDFALATENAPPLDSNRYQQLYKNLDELRYGGFSLKKVGMVLLSTALIAQAYINHYETVTGNESFVYVPFIGFALPAYNLYSSGGQIREQYNRWAQAETSDEKYNNFFELLGGLTKFSYNIIRLIVYFAAAEMAETLQLALSTLMYITALADIFQAEYSSYPSIEERHHMTPHIIKV